MRLHHVPRVGMVLALAVALGVSLGQPAAAKSVDELLGIACGDGGPPDFISEIRQAASAALAERLVMAQLDLAELEEISALGRTQECRQAPIPALIEAYLALDPVGEGSAEALLAKVSTAPSLELASARALAAITRFQQKLLVTGLPPDEVLVDLISTVLSGGSATLLEITIDGSNPVIRAAVGQVTEQFLFLLGRSVFGEQICQAFKDFAVSAPTAEFRQTAANVYVNSGCITPDVESLTALAQTGESPELRTAAVGPLSEALASSDLSAEELQMLALDLTTTAEHRRAAGLALGTRWTEVVTIDPNTGHPVVDGVDLIKFAALHTGAHPELAVAAVMPMAAAFSVAP